MSKYNQVPNCTVQIKQIKYNEQCNLCKGKLVATDVDLVCSKCGIVVDEKIVDSSRDFENKDGSGGRVGPPTNQMWKINENSSVISQTGKDASGHRITGENRALVRRISLWDKRAKSNGTDHENLIGGGGCCQPLIPFPNKRCYDCGRQWYSSITC